MGGRSANRFLLFHNIASGWVCLRGEASRVTQLLHIYWSHDLWYIIQNKPFSIITIFSLCFAKNGTYFILFFASPSVISCMHLSCFNALLVYMTFHNMYYIISFCSAYRVIDSRSVLITNQQQGNVKLNLESLKC